MDFLVIADAHVEPGQNQDRFDFLGEFIVEHRPTAIVSLGDFVSMGSLSEWDKNKNLIMEGKRFKHDIEAGVDAVRRMFSPLLMLQSKQRMFKKKLYIPKVVWIDGNHEDRINRYVEQNAEMEGYINGFYNYVEDIIKTCSDQVFYIKYKDYLTYSCKETSISFLHAPINAAGKPISGEFVCRRALDLFNNHVVFGHSHSFRVESRFRHGGDGNLVKQAVSCGCFFDETPEYAIGAANNYFPCIVGIDVRSDGLLDIKTFEW